MCTREGFRWNCLIGARPGGGGRLGLLLGDGPARPALPGLGGISPARSGRGWLDRPFKTTARLSSFRWPPTNEPGPVGSCYEPKPGFLTVMTGLRSKFWRLSYKDSVGQFRRQNDLDSKK